MNAFGVLALVVVAIEAITGGTLCVTAARAIRRMRAADRLAPAAQDDATRHLLVLLATLLATLSLVSLALWGLLLQSSVPNWIGVRCIAGVVKVGTGSTGAAGWLPTLASATTALRLALLLGAGAAVVLHIVARDRPGGTLSRRHVGALGVVGVLAIAAASVQSTYVLIPKQEQPLASGCCSVVPQTTSELELRAPVPAAGIGARLLAAGLGSSALLLAVPVGRSDVAGAKSTVSELAQIGGYALFTWAGLQFVSGVVAPARLGLPLHHCIYCLVAGAPETIVGLGLLVTPAIAVTWRSAARWIVPGEGATYDRVEQTLGRAAVFASVATPVFFGVQWGIS